MDSNALFHLLPQAHRDRFLAALRDPESDEAKQLLSEAVAGGEGGLVTDDRLPAVLPWWEKNQLEPNEEDLDGGIQHRESPYASEPEIVAETVIGAIDPSKEIAIKLAYNAIAVWSVAGSRASVAVTDTQSAWLTYMCSSLSGYHHCRPNTLPANRYHPRKSSKK